MKNKYEIEFSRQGTRFTVEISQSKKDKINELYSTVIHVGDLNYTFTITDSLLRNKKELKKTISDEYFNYWIDYIIK
jgi:hypothetical protein